MFQIPEFDGEDSLESDNEDIAQEEAINFPGIVIKS